MGHGSPYNRVASSLLDACLEGAVVVCGYRDGECIPLDSDAAEKVYNAVKNTNNSIRK